LEIDERREEKKERESKRQGKWRRNSIEMRWRDE
jgi:hypothetical protein